MLKIIMYLGSALLLMNVSSALAKVTYNQNQLQQFIQTNQCPGCDLSSANLTGNHSQANLDKANLSETTASYMNLSEATLTNANMTNTDLRASNLSSANFSGSALFGANLAGANLYKATITTEQLAQATSVCGAIMPDGTKGKCN